MKFCYFCVCPPSNLLSNYDIEESAQRVFSEDEIHEKGSYCAVYSFYIFYRIKIRKADIETAG